MITKNRVGTAPAVQANGYEIEKATCPHLLFVGARDNYDLANRVLKSKS
jgi:hypothetical protein